MFSRLTAERIQSDPKKYGQPKGSNGFSSRLLSDLYIEQFGKDSLKKLEFRLQVPVSETREPGERQKKNSDETVLDERAFYAEVHKAIVALQPVGEAKHRTLALDRSIWIQALLVQKGQVADACVFLLDVDDEGSRTAGSAWISNSATKRGIVFCNEGASSSRKAQGGLDYYEIGFLKSYRLENTYVDK